MNTWDQGMRYASKLDPDEFCRWLLHRYAPRRRFRRWLDTRTIPYPGHPDRTCDTVAEMEHDQGTQPPIAVVFELKPQQELDAYPQVLRYALTLHDELRNDTSTRDKYEVVACLVFLTGAEAPEKWEMKPADCKGLSVGGNLGVVVFSEQSLNRLFADIKAGQAPLSALCWASVMRGGDDPKKIEQWKRLAETEPSRSRRADYAFLALLFAERLGRQDLWKTALEGWNVEESLVVKELMQAAEKRAEERGEMRALRESIVQILKARFSQAVPSAVRQRLKAQDEPARLQDWHRRALVVASLETWLEETR